LLKFCVLQTRGAASNGKQQRSAAASSLAQPAASKGHDQGASLAVSQLSISERASAPAAAAPAAEAADQLMPQQQQQLSQQELLFEQLPLDPHPLLPSPLDIFDDDFGGIADFSMEPLDDGSQYDPFSAAPSFGESSCVVIASQELARCATVQSQN
jgi:hypothetical protein